MGTVCSENKTCSSIVTNGDVRLDGFHLVAKNVPENSQCIPYELTICLLTTNRRARLIASNKFAERNHDRLSFWKFLQLWGTII